MLEWSCDIDPNILFFFNLKKIGNIESREFLIFEVSLLSKFPNFNIPKKFKISFKYYQDLKKL